MPCDVVPGSSPSTRRRGKLLVNLAFGHPTPFVLALLTVDGQHGASGRFVARLGSFMPLQRAAERRATAHEDFAVRRATQGRVPEVTAAAATPLDDLGDLDFRFFLQLHLPGLRLDEMRWVDLDRTERWLDDGAGSWAHLLPKEESVIAQGGPRRVWDEAERIHQRWQDLGKPAHDRFGLTVHPDGRHTLWLDTPGGQHHWDLPN